LYPALEYRLNTYIPNVHSHALDKPFVPLLPPFSRVLILLQSQSHAVVAAGIPFVGPFTGARFLRFPYSGHGGSVINMRASYDDEVAAMVRKQILLSCRIRRFDLLLILGCLLFPLKNAVYLACPSPNKLFALNSLQARACPLVGKLLCDRRPDADFHLPPGRRIRCCRYGGW
jgi:hypothetical protein